MTAELEVWAMGDELFAEWVAGIYALCDAKDRALDCLERAVENGFIAYPYLSEIDPFLESVRGEDRFEELMARVKHEWETFEV